MVNIPEIWSTYQKYGQHNRNMYLLAMLRSNRGAAMGVRSPCNLHLLEVWSPCYSHLLGVRLSSSHFFILLPSNVLKSLFNSKIFKDKSESMLWKLLVVDKSWRKKWESFNWRTCHNKTDPATTYHHCVKVKIEKILVKKITAKNPFQSAHFSYPKWPFVTQKIIKKPWAITNFSKKLIISLNE